VSEVLEGRLHPLAVVVLARRVVGAGILPVLVLVVSGGVRVIVPLLLGAGAVLAYAVLAWSRFRYRVAEGRLELRSGVLSRSVRTIPLDRVRGVVVTAPFVHRLLGLVKVEVEAAAGGGSKAELSLPAVSVAQADALRKVLLEATGATGESESEPAVLYRARPGQLALGGITSLSYLLAPAAVVGVVANLADNLPGGVLERAGETIADNVPTDPLGIGAVAAGAVVLVLALAAAGSLLVDWDFALRDEGDRLTAARGLLTRRLVVLERARIRGADVRDTPLRRPLHLVSVTAIAAGLRGKSGGTTLAPVLAADEVAALLRAVDPAAPDPSAPLTAHPSEARRRRLLRALALPVAALVVALVLVEAWAIAAAALVTILVIPLALDRYRQLGHAFDGRRLAVREGSLRRRWSELDPGAVVAYDVRSSPGQRRARLCTVIVHLGQGAGSRRALDAGEPQAAALLGALDPPLLGPLVAAQARGTSDARSRSNSGA
jgi:putative membrane protein